jgi:hypothetical protein
MLKAIMEAPSAMTVVQSMRAYYGTDITNRSRNGNNIDALLECMKYEERKDKHDDPGQYLQHTADRIVKIRIDLRKPEIELEGDRFSRIDDACVEALLLINEQIRAMQRIKIKR